MTAGRAASVIVLENPQTSMVRGADSLRLKYEMQCSGGSGRMESCVHFIKVLRFHDDLLEAA